MTLSRLSLLSLLAATSLLTACGDYGAEPIITGNDRTVTSGSGPGGFMGGAVGTLPSQGGNVQSAPVDSAPAPTYSNTSSNSLPMPNEAPAVPVEVVTKGQPSAMAATAPAAPAQKGCDYIDLLGKKLADSTVTDLIKQGKVVRELKPGDAVTMEYLENRVNIIVDPATKNVVDVTCG